MLLRALYRSSGSHAHRYKAQDQISFTVLLGGFIHRLRRTRYMVTPDKIKFRAPLAACVEIQAMPVPCRHVGESPGWELADSIMFPICFFGTACSFRIFPEPQELTHVLICT